MTSPIRLFARTVTLLGALSASRGEAQEYREPLPLDTTTILGCWQFSDTAPQPQRHPSIILSVLANSSSRPINLHSVRPLDASPDFHIDPDFSTWRMDSLHGLNVRWGDKDFYYTFRGSFAANVLLGKLSVVAAVLDGHPVWTVRAHRVACPP